MYRFVCVWTVVIAVVLGQDADIKGLTITNAERELDLTTQLVKVKTTFEFEASESVSSFVYSVEPQFSDKVAFIEATVDSKTLKQPTSSTGPAVEGAGNAVNYKFTLASPVKGSGKIVVVVEIAHAISPFPTHIQQTEQQLVEYKGNAHVFSPYPIKSEKTTVKLASSKLEHFTKVVPSKADGDTVNYGAYDNTKPYTQKAIRVHYENNQPFLVITSMERLIEVSHWGNVAVEEQIVIEHQGAQLKGSFSRYDYQRDHRGVNQPSVGSFKTLLPAAARDVYYRDEIGNISTSHMRQHDDAVELIVRPRFPLFGGWRTVYTLGYNVPSYEYLFVNGNDYALKMRFLDHVFDNMIVDELTVKVILPERSDKLKLSTPFKVRRSPDQRHFTYLDYSGRPVLTAHKSLLTEKHIQPFELHYTYERSSMLCEPIMIVVAFYVLFFVVIMWVRLDFTIAKDEISESRLRVQGMVEKVADQHVQRLQTYDQYVEAGRIFSQNKDTSTYNSKKKRVETDLKTATDSIANLQQEIKAENADCADKLNELQRLHKQTMDLLNNYTQAAEKLVKGGQKSLFAEAEKKFKQNFDEVREKMDTVVYSL